VQLLVAVRDGALGVDPDQRVGDARRGRGGRFVDPDVDRQRVCAGGRLETLDEWGAGGGEAQRDGFRRGRGDVVGCFGEEERLENAGHCVNDEDRQRAEMWRGIQKSYGAGLPGKGHWGRNINLVVGNGE
jgi:hypothetical protein